MNPAAYRQWRAHLRGEGLRDYVRGIYPGFWRCRFGAANEWTPLATFEVEGEVVGLLLGEIHTAAELEDMGLWPKAARNPISEAVYRAVAEEGQSWPATKQELVSP